MRQGFNCSSSQHLVSISSCTCPKENASKLCELLQISSYPVTLLQASLESPSQTQVKIFALAYFASVSLADDHRPPIGTAFHSSR